MRIRLHDTPEMVEESADYPDRGTSKKVRRYVDIRFITTDPAEEAQR